MNINITQLVNRFNFFLFDKNFDDKNKLIKYSFLMDFSLINLIFDEFSLIDLYLLINVYSNNFNQIFFIKPFFDFLIKLHNNNLINFSFFPVNFLLKNLFLDNKILSQQKIFMIKSYNYFFLGSQNIAIYKYIKFKI